DIITALDTKKVNGFSDLTSFINTKRPDEVVNVTIIRDGDKKTIPVKLTKKELLAYEFNGIELEDIDSNDKKNFKIDFGVKIKNITNENYLDYANELEGSIIMSIDGMKAENVDKVSSYLNRKKGSKAQYQIITKNKQIVRIIM
ncbi:MAG: PDZ domain-containing protein, partial [Flavobacterium sp.]